MMKYLNEVNTANEVVNCIVVEDTDVSTDVKKAALLSALGLTGTHIVADSNYIGGSYDVALGKLIYSQPYTSWILDADGLWQAPNIGQTLLEGVSYDWNEAELQWVEVGEV